MLRILVAAMVLAPALVAGGCSDDPSREEFQAQVVETRDRTDAALEHITRAETYDDLLERIDVAAAAAEAAADDLADAGAPGELEDEADELTVALRALGVELAATADALNDEQFEGSTVQGLEFENWNRVQAALADLRTQGIEVEPLERH